VRHRIAGEPLDGLLQDIPCRHHRV
jgi:hypothetical protein